jgi:hypothetical protein
MEESRSPIIEQWKVLEPIIEKLSLPRNFKPNLPTYGTPRSSEECIVEIWSFNEDTKTVSAKYERYGTMTGTRKSWKCGL